MQTPSPVAAARRTYDLFHRGDRFSWRIAAHGVTLTGDSIAWIADGQEHVARLNDIAAVHLQTGNIGQNTIASCRLGFRDGSALLIASHNSNGLQDDLHDKLYADFVNDLHARLAVLKDTEIAFTAGFSDTRYRFGQAVIVIAVLFFLVTPTVLLLMTGSWSMVWTLYLGVGLVWPLYRVMMANAPRSYDPRDVPQELVPTA